MQYLELIPFPERRGVRVVVADRSQQIAIGLIEVGAHDRAGRRYVEAGLFDQPVADDRGREARIGIERGKPDRIDLHHAKIGRAIRVGAYETGASALDRLDRGQHARWQSVEMRHQCHAGEIGN